MAALGRTGRPPALTTRGEDRRKSMNCMRFRSFADALRSPAGAASLVGVAAVACAGGSGPSEPACLAEAAAVSCTSALYGLHGGQIAPTFQEVFDNTISKVCAASGCHSGRSPQAGLALDDIDAAHRALLATNASGERRVIAGDVKCGKVIVRLETSGEPWSMPPGAHLDEQALCSIRHWIKNGAPR